MDQLQLPLYAIEQFLETGLLRRCDDPLLGVLLRRPMAIASTFDTLVNRLMRSQSQEVRPTDSLPIGHKSRRIGGMAKPWSDIYKALIAKRIAFWPADGIGVERLHVARGSLDAFIGAKPRQVRVTAPDMSTLDAAELLNIIPRDVRRLRVAGVLSDKMISKAPSSPRVDVEALAIKYVSAAEIARRTRTSAEHVNNQLRELGFANFHGLRNRNEMLEVLQLR